MTLKSVFKVHTGCTIEARSGGTFVNIHCTVDSSEARFTHTFNSPAFVSAGHGIHTQIWLFAQINVDLTVPSLVPQATVTAVTIHLINTEPSVLTRIGEALIQVVSTINATVARDTMALVSIYFIQACAMDTRGRRTLVDIDFTYRT